MAKQSIQQQIFERLGGIDQRLQGIEKHLSVLNGKVAEHERRLNDEERQNFYDKGTKNATKYMITIGLGVAAIIVAIIFHN